MPHFLAWRLREHGYSARLIHAAHEINAQMPGHVVQKVGDALNAAGRPISGSRVLLLGVAYKPDVHDTRESPSLVVMRELLERHGEVSYCDPWVAELELDGVHHRGVAWAAETVRGADCVGCSRRIAASSRSHSGRTRAWLWTPGTWCPMPLECTGSSVSSTGRGRPRAGAREASAGGWHSPRHGNRRGAPPGRRSASARSVREGGVFNDVDFAERGRHCAPLRTAK